MQPGSSCSDVSPVETEQERRSLPRTEISVFTLWSIIKPREVYLRAQMSICKLNPVSSLCIWGEVKLGICTLGTGFEQDLCLFVNRINGEAFFRLVLHSMWRILEPAKYVKNSSISMSNIVTVPDPDPALFFRGFPDAKKWYFLNR
jgi:hypothetical protein